MRFDNLYNWCGDRPYSTANSSRDSVESNQSGKTVNRNPSFGMSAGATS